MDAAARRHPGGRLAGIAVVAVLAAGLLAVKVPTVGAAAGGLYHRYAITRRSYEARYGRWVRLSIPARFRVNGIHSTLLYDGDVLIMAGSGNNQAFFNAGTFKTLLLNPVTMTERLIPTPWDLFCAGHVELPDGNILIAGGTARYENLKPVRAAGAMTVVNADPAQPVTLPKGTVFTAPDGARFASAFALTLPRAAAVGGRVTPAQRSVWVDAVRKGRGSLVPAAARYSVAGLLGPQAGRLVYGTGTPMTLQKQNFQGTNDAYIFNVRTSRFQKVNSMNYARWYPTLAELGNGMVMAVSGLNGQGQVTMNSEDYDPASGTWTPGPARGFPTYPATFLTEDGQLFFTGSSAGYGPATPAWRTPGFWDPATSAFTPVPGIPAPADLETSASVLLPPAQRQEIMVMGGGGVGQSDASTARTALIDVAAPDPRWVRGPDLAQPTRYPITVLLPTDQVLVTGGSRYYRGEHGSDNRDTRIYDVATNSFQWAASAITGRDYHSGGLLLPDGSVLTLGGNPLFGNKQDTAPQTFNQEIDVYEPPYLFRGPRPRITAAPRVLAPGHSYAVTVPGARDIAYLRLMRPDNPTHVTDVNERSVAIPFRAAGASRLVITVPPGGNLIPPSYYMLFAVSRAGIPSPGYWVRVP
jgi:hypothetical protein